MAQYNSPSTLTGLFKEVYGDDIKNLIPETSKLTKMFPFVEKEKQEGNKYHQPVIVSAEQGATYAAASAGAFALNDHIASTLQDAQVEGSQILLRAAIGYDAAAKAAKGKKAFADATELLVENLLESHTKRLELSILYGRSGLGLGDSSVNASATSTVITFTTASWASGIWSGLENAVLNFYNNPADTLVSSGADANFTITAVSVSARTITVTGTATGITALDSALASTGQADAFFLGSHGAEMYGLNSILTNTGSLFNISAATYGLWAANTSSAGSAQLSMTKILNGISKAAQRGLNESTVVLCNPDGWTNVMSDLAALRKYDGSYDRKKGDNGFESLMFYSQAGEIEVVPYNIVKEGDAFILPKKKVRRLGATEITFKTPGREDEIFLQLPSNAGYEIRSYSDQAIFLETPARATKITSIVNV